MTWAPHVLIIVENLPVPFDRRVWMEATSLRDAGYVVSVICPTGKGYEERFEILDEIRVHRHPLPPEGAGAFGYLREYAHALFWEFRLARQVRRERPIDVVHICNPPDLLFLVAGWQKLFGGARIVFDHHDVNPELYVEKYGRRDLFFHGLRLAERLTFAVSDVALSTNDSYRAIALERGGMDPDDVFVVRSAPDLQVFQPVQPDPAFRHGRQHVVGYVGVMAEQDGVDLLLRSIGILVHERGVDVQLQLIGGGPALDDLKSLASELKIDDHVEFAGFRQGQDLLRRLSSCDVGAAPDPPSDYNSKCTMNKVLEYMALGLPVVQFDVKEGRASAEDASMYAENDSIASFAAKLERLLLDEEMRARMGEVGRKRMEDRLEWRHSVPTLLAAYERVLER